MGSGYIQLLTVGSEVNIFNYNPNISFFKIYYRRHTNFLINNMEINGNIIKKNTQNTTNLITFNIPKNGDLLGKSYINMNVDEHYFELFKYNDELCSTFIVNLLDVYNSYYIKTNNYSIEDITNILIVKINYSNNGKLDNFLSIVSNLFNQYVLLNLIKSQIYYTLETDINNIFYNIDLNLLFYSFNVIINSNLLNNDLFQYIIKNIVVEQLSYIQIDFIEKLISIRITYFDNKYYKVLLDLIFSNNFIDMVKQIKIDNSYVYMSLNFSNELYNLLIELLYVNSKIFELEIIKNKISSNKNTFTEKINDKLLNIILNKNFDTTIYLSILNGDIKSNSILTIMEKIPFFGNLTNEYFNDLLIKESNNTLNFFNLNNKTISLNLLIKIYISLVCYKEDLTIQNYLKIVNNNKIINFIDTIKQYKDNVSLLNYKLIQFIMDPDVLIVNNKTFYLIIYSKNTFENFELNNYTQPFSNNNISYYTNIIQNFNFNQNTIQTYNKEFNNISNDFDYVVSLFLFLSSFSKSTLERAVINNNLTINYIENNNFFSNAITELLNITLNNISFFDYLNILKNTNNFFIQTIINNSFLLLISQSIIFNNQNLSNTLLTYNSTGRLSNMYINTKISRSVFPFSSSIYVFTNNGNYICENNRITNSKLYFNYNLSEYVSKININLTEITEEILNDLKINILNDDLNTNVEQYLNDSTILKITTIYYKQTTNFLREINMKFLNDYLEEIKNIKYNLIYPLYNESVFNLNNNIMYQQFNYIDKNLFNNSFTNFIFDKHNICNDSSYKTNFINEVNFEKFIFTINSPIYRIYFYFTFIAKISIYLEINKIKNVNVNNDINILRDLTISFILYFFKVFNNYQINSLFMEFIEKFNLQKINNNMYFIQSNFLCYDDINIFKNNEFLKNILNKNSNKYLFIYNNFYFTKLNLLNYKIDNINFLNNIPDISKKINYNYDDLIIFLFTQVLNDNSDKFINFSKIYDFTLDFFNSNEFNYDKILEYFYYFINSSVSNINNKFQNYDVENEYSVENFYYICYYSSFIIGSTFDNINLNNVQTINNITDITSLYDNQYLFNYEYTLKEFNSKQYLNYLDNTTNLIDVFKYFSLKLFSIFINKNYIEENYFNNYLNLIISYVNVNQNFLIIYLISEFDYNNSILIINSVINKFNSTNNTNLSLSTNNDDVKFITFNSKFNLIVILYYYIYFIYKCLSIDINDYNTFLYNLNINFISGNNVEQIITLGEFVIKKYTTNIYNDCIESLIKLFTNTGYYIDFSTYYFYVLNLNTTNKNSSTRGNNFYITDQNIYTNILKNNNDINETYNNLNYSQIKNYYLNSYNNLFTDNNLKIIFINKNFNILYSNTINNLINKTNTIFLSIYNDKDLFSKIISNNNLSLQLNYSDYKLYYYNNSIYYLSIIYNNLNDSDNFNNSLDSNNKYVKRIISIILNNLKNFFNYENNNYFYTLYYLSNQNIINKINVNLIYNIYKNFLNQKIINDDEYNFISTEINNLLNTTDTYAQYTVYLNGLISNSLIYEEYINRIIYLLCTNYLIDNSPDKKSTKNFIYKKTLYDIVKLYINNQNITNENKIYLNNTSIYSNQSIFQIFNYENMYNNLSFTQNYWINYIISNIEYEKEKSNSYYNLFLKFINYVKFYELDLLNFKLDNGILILEYFQNYSNYDELLNYIYNYICLNEPYSPNLIFINIIDLLKTNKINSKLMIDTNHLKKKITIFLFFTWIILNTTVSLLIDFFEINKNIILEYNINSVVKVDIKLLDVLNYNNNMEIINWSIYEIYNMEPTINNKNLNINNNPIFLQNNIEIIELTKKAKLFCSPIVNFNLLCNIYINKYYDVIGFEDIYTNKLFIDDSFKQTLTNLVSDINIAFNNDINGNNTNQYELTFNSLQLLNMKFNSMIYDLNNTSQNKLLLTSEFTFNSKKNYSKTVINDLNLLYNLFCLLLNNYSISYSNLKADYNLIQNYLRKSASSINELFEIFKGYMSNYEISLGLTSIENLSKYNYFIEKLYNIKKLNYISSYFNNLSLITPNDYDNIPILINYDYAYGNFYNKYYSYNYNYYNFENNFTVIYKNLYSYYAKIVNDVNAIKNVKSYNMNLYVWLFTDLINSFISTTYYDVNSINPDAYFNILNQIIKLYFTYNYSFRLNNNIEPINNLVIQNKYSNVPTLSNYTEINLYLLSYYFYQLFSQDIKNNNSSKYTNDVVLFFNTLIVESNTNFLYTRNFLNCVFKFEVILRFIAYKINNIYGINIDVDTDLDNTINSINTINLINVDNKKINKITKSIKILINFITDINNVINFFNTQYFDKLDILYSYSYYQNLFSVINNLIDKKIFYDKFIYSLSELIYWINDYSYDVNVINTFTKYFDNVYFEYFEYIDNQYIIRTYTFDVFTIYYLINTYIYYILTKNTEFVDRINLININIYNTLFDISNSIINPEIIYDILSMNYNSELFLKTDTKPNLYISKDDINYNIKLSSFINDIFGYIINNYWGIINYNIIENTYRQNLRTYITLYNMYYSYLNYLVVNKNNNYQDYNFAYYLNIFDELYILYIIMINTYTLQFINIPVYYNLQQQYLTYSHKYIKYNIEINTLNLNQNFAVYMDNLNLNIIPNNSINNYYKNIQNNSIYDCVKYKIYTFKNNVNNYSDYTIQIYNNQVVKLNFNDENTLSSNTFYNIIINTFGNLSANVKIYLKDLNIIFNDIIETLTTNIDLQFTYLSENFGGTDNNSITTSISEKKRLFNEINYKNENSQITIFSLINREVNRKNLYNNIPILIFYYSCYITWSTLGLNIIYDLDYVSDLFYTLANRINTEILKFLNEQSNISINLFFDGLNILLFNNYNNYEFIVATTKFFNEIISLNYAQISNTILNNLIKINNSLIIDYNSNLFDNYDLNNDGISLPKLKNNKIIIYKNLLGLLADFNSSKLVYYIKSIDNIFNDVKVQEKIINYIIKLNEGIVNEYGIIKIINRIELLFDDEIIAQYFNFNYKVFIDNFQNINKQGLLDKMLGLKGIDYESFIVSGIKPFIKFAHKKNFIIPIKFFFENYFNSIPLISCMNTNILIKVYLNNGNIYKDSYFINLITPINIVNKLNSDFILLERDERIRLSTKKIDNLIERNNYYEFIKNITDFLISNDNIIDINFDMDLNNMVKEIIWTFKITIDNYEINILNNIVINNNFLDNITINNLVNSNYDFILNTKFYLDGLRRDGVLFLDSNNSPNYNKITTILNPYKYNTKVNLDKNYNTYSFALKPTDFQPSGAINMSNYKTFKVVIQIDKIKFLKYLNNINTLFNLKDVNFKMCFTTYEYNILRYQSSLAGLLFI